MVENVFQMVVVGLLSDFVVECFLFVFWLNPEMLSLHRKFHSFFLFFFVGVGICFLSF